MAKRSPEVRWAILMVALSLLVATPRPSGALSLPSHVKEHGLDKGLRDPVPVSLYKIVGLSGREPWVRYRPWAKAYLVPEGLLREAFDARAGDFVYSVTDKLRAHVRSESDEYLILLVAGRRLKSIDYVNNWKEGAVEYWTATFSYDLTPNLSGMPIRGPFKGRVVASRHPSMENWRYEVAWGDKGADEEYSKWLEERWERIVRNVNLAGEWTGSMQAFNYLGTEPYGGPVEIGASFKHDGGAISGRMRFGPMPAALMGCERRSCEWTVGPTSPDLTLSLRFHNARFKIGLADHGLMVGFIGGTREAIIYSAVLRRGNSPRPAVPYSPDVAPPGQMTTTPAPAPSNRTSPTGALVLTVDGIDRNTIKNETIARAFPSRTAYLLPVFQKLTEGEGATVTWFEWDGDPQRTPELVDELAKRISRLITDAQGRRTIVAAHSWGGVLAYLAIRRAAQEGRIAPGSLDLLMTIHTPLAMPGPDSLRAIGADPIAYYVKGMVNAAIGSQLQHLPSVRKWRNYYSTSDWLSGPVPVANDNVDTGRDHSAAYSDPAMQAEFSKAIAALTEIAPTVPRSAESKTAKESRPASPPSESANRWYVGIWEGRIRQGALFSHPTVMTLRETTDGRISGEISYPSVPCQGTLTLERIEGGTLLMKAEIHSGSNRCRGGMIRVRPTPEKQVTLESADATGRVMASGTLIRKRP